ncbi:MAG: RluA family pseudouridine synthase [Clostridia bacterium]|nr:RluA family pseudouridine synthase [Clostridia bacterium]
MKSYNIGINDAGQRVDKFVSKLCPDLPKSMLYKYIRIKRIKVNKKRTEIGYMLNENDLVELYINDEFFDAETADISFMDAEGRIDVIYEDEHILIVNKPAGIIVHEDNNIKGETLIDNVKKYLYNKGEYDPQAENTFAPALCNRIDRNTSGLVIAAKTAAALREMAEKIRTGQVHKYYYTLVMGTPYPPEADLFAYLVKNDAENRVQIFDDKVDGAREIHTEYKTVESFGWGSILEINLHTGRPHQIRAHMAHIGYPVAGDTKYGNPGFNKKTGLSHQVLSAYKLVFDFDETEGTLGYLNGKTVCLDKNKCDVFKTAKRTGGKYSEL